MQERSGLAAILVSFRTVGVVALVLDILRDQYPGKDRLCGCWRPPDRRWSPMQKKFAAVSSLLSAEVNPDMDRCSDMILRPGVSCRNSIRAPAAAPSGANQGARCPALR
jgi:hypothetical protein